MGPFPWRCGGKWNSETRVWCHRNKAFYDTSFSHASLREFLFWWHYKNPTSTGNRRGRRELPIDDKRFVMSVTHAVAMKKVRKLQKYTDLLQSRCFFKKSTPRQFLLCHRYRQLPDNRAGAECISCVDSRDDHWSWKGGNMLHSFWSPCRCWWFFTRRIIGGYWDNFGASPLWFSRHVEIDTFKAEAVIFFQLFLLPYSLASWRPPWSIQPSKTTSWVDLWCLPLFFQPPYLITQKCSHLYKSPKMCSNSSNPPHVHPGPISAPSWKTRATS